MRKIRNILIALANRLSYVFPDELYLKLQFRLRMGYKLNLDNPNTLSEKIQWLKLHDRNPEYTYLVDKFEVKNRIAQKIGGEHIIQTLWVWDKVEDINFDCLPKQFVLKTTHGGGNSGVVVCTDKDKLDRKATILKLKKSFKQDIFNDFRERPYKNVKKRIIAEQFMSQDDGAPLIDYKFFCFNGKPQYVYVSQNIPGAKRQLSCFLTMDWKLAPFKKRDEDYATQAPTKPDTFDEMYKLATKLCVDIPFVRVDLYEINKQVYFSELTFYPSSGMQPFDPLEWNYKLGELLTLPEKRS